MDNLAISGADASSAALLRRFAAYYRRHPRLLAVDLGCAVASGLLELVFPVAVTLFVDRLLPGGDLGLIALAALGLAIVYLVNGALQVVVTYWGHMLGVRIEAEMRRRAFEHLQKLSFAYFDDQKTGHLVARLTSDLEEIGEVAHHGPEDILIALMTLVGAFLLMLWMHVPLALVTAVILPLSAVVILRYGGRMARTWRSIYGRVADFNARVEENVGGIRVVQAFGNEEHEKALFAANNAAYVSTKLEAYRILATAMSLSYVSMRFVHVVVMLVGAWFVVHQRMTPGEFVGFLLLVGVFFRPMEMISAVIDIYPRGIAGFRRYTEFLDTEPDLSDRPGARTVTRLAGEIVYRDVRFGYRPGRPVLDGFDLSVRVGETVALVGPSGAGKTTICALLPRFYDVEAGAISIDGVDVRDMTLASLRAQVGIVQQDVFLFAGTIRENIAYGRLDASEAEIVEAARRARLDDVIAALANGIDTVVGERGVKLSGGQKQRLAIARVFLKDPPILILDEATSALDAETERAIRQSLDDLSTGRTTLVVAHRLTTVREADRIVVVDGGAIVEQGRHDDLIRIPGGRYRALAMAGADEGAQLS